MPILLTDGDIERLLAEKKPLPDDYRKRLPLKAKRGHKEGQIDVKGVDGSEFRVILRQGNENPLNFSAILAYLVPLSNQIFRLLRYNGKSHEHTNKLEGQILDYGFHIHHATDRYQESGWQEDVFAERTDRYSDFSSAVDCLIMDCGFELPHDPQSSLFRTGGLNVS